MSSCVSCSSSSPQKLPVTLSRISLLLCVQIALHAECLRTYDPLQHAIGVLKRQPIHALERNEDHRELSHVLLAQRRLLRDRQAVEQRPVRPDLEKALEHAHVQRLAEAPRAREKIDLCPSCSAGRGSGPSCRYNKSPSCRSSAKLSMPTGSFILFIRAPTFRAASFLCKRIPRSTPFYHKPRPLSTVGLAGDRAVPA